MTERITRLVGVFLPKSAPACSHVVNDEIIFDTRNVHRFRNRFRLRFYDRQTADTGCGDDKRAKPSRVARKMDSRGEKSLSSGRMERDVTRKEDEREQAVKRRRKHTTAG